MQPITDPLFTAVFRGFINLLSLGRVVLFGLKFVQSRGGLIAVRGLYLWDR